MAQKTTYPFPYFNAGEATYCDTIQLIVVFKNNPSKNIKAQIKETAPQPIGIICFEDEYLSTFNDNNLHVEISKTYHTSDGKSFNEKLETPTQFNASMEQQNAFNDDIERWLKEIHKMSPIYFAFKNELDGVEINPYSNWHYWSLNQYKSILPYFETEINNGYDFHDFSEKANIIQNILSKVERTSVLEEKYLKFLHPGKLEFEAFKNEDIQPLKSIKNVNYANKAFAYINKNLDTEHKENSIKYIDTLLSFEQIIDNSSFEELTQKLFSIINDVDTNAFKKVAAKITSITFVSRLAESGYRLMRQQKYKEAQDLFIKLLAAPAEATVHSGFYTNMLWVFQNDNTGLPIDKKRNELALQKCLSKAKEYPHIFYNACCIYVEMQNYNKAYEMVEQALAHFVEKELMLNEIKEEPLFKEFREKTNVLTLLENHKPETNTNPKLRFISKSVAYERFKIHNIYSNGLEVDFTHILLLNGHVTIDGALNTVFKSTIEQIADDKKKILVIINGNVEAKSIGEIDKTEVLIMGALCNGLTHSKNVTERKQTNFNYTPITIKKEPTNRAYFRDFDFETWGTDILENEISREVYHKFYETHTSDGVAPTEILKTFEANFVESYTDKGIPNSCDYWFAIGLALWELGALQKDTRIEIEDYYNRGRDKEKWLELDVSDKAVAERETIVNQFLKKLKTPSQTTHQLNCYPIERPAIFNAGECITFKYTDGSYGGFIVLEEINDEMACEMPANKIVITTIKQDTKPTKSNFIDALILKIKINSEACYATFLYGTRDFYIDKNRFSYIDHLILNTKKTKRIQAIDFFSKWEHLQRYIHNGRHQQTSLANISIKELLK